MTESILHPVFMSLSMQELTPENFDRALKDSSSGLTGIFFWGHDCPNCEVAKRILNEESRQVKELGIHWFHVNTYHHLELGTRFGLHGIPTFLFFHQQRKLGKISPFPGIEPFMEVLRKLRAQYPQLSQPI